MDDGFNTSHQIELGKQISELSFQVGASHLVEQLQVTASMGLDSFSLIAILFEVLDSTWKKLEPTLFTRSIDAEYGMG